MVGMGDYSWTAGYFTSVVLIPPAVLAVLVEPGGGSKAATVSFGTTATTFNDGNWHQAAMVIDQTANTAQIYVDGVAQALSVPPDGNLWDRLGNQREYCGLYQRKCH